MSAVLGPQVAALACRVANVVHTPAVVAALEATIGALADAGERGLDVGVVRDPRQALAVALLDAAGVVESVDRGLRLTAAARSLCAPGGRPC